MYARICLWRRDNDDNVVEHAEHAADDPNRDSKFAIKVIHASALIEVIFLIMEIIELFTNAYRIIRSAMFVLVSPS